MGSYLQCRRASAIWFNHWWHLTSSTLISVWSCCTPGPGVPARYALHLTADIIRRQKREDRRVALATSGSTRFRRMPTLYYYLRCGDLRSPGVTERRNGSLGLRDDDDDDDEGCKTCVKMEGKTNFRGTYRLSGTEIVECLKITDLRCNLKQFDLEADRKCIFHFWP